MHQNIDLLLPGAGLKHMIQSILNHNAGTACPKWRPSETTPASNNLPSLLTWVHWGGCNQRLAGNTRLLYKGLLPPLGWANCKKEKRKWRGYFKNGFFFFFLNMSSSLKSIARSERRILRKNSPSQSTGCNHLHWQTILLTLCFLFDAMLAVTISHTGHYTPAGRSTARCISQLQKSSLPHVKSEVTWFYNNSPSKHETSILKITQQPYSDLFILHLIYYRNSSPHL